MTKRGNILLPLISAVVLVALLAAGYLFWQNQQLQTTNSLTPTPTVTPIQDETANWKTYMDEKFYYTIKYPPGWNVEKRQLEENSESLVISEKKFPTEPLTHGFIGAFIVTVYYGPKVYENAEFHPWVAIEGQPPISRVEEIDFNGIKVKQTVIFGDNPIGDPNTTTLNFLYLNNSFAINYPNQYQTQFDHVIYDQILSTFKFL